ncbi:hypothetical protein T440DRAFT_473814, partial [Plenodomus tracheiphilus IPT5]
MASSRNTTVHDIPLEMLELVLLKLDMEDILRSMGVCKRWIKCITDSPQLQVSLFMKPLERSKKAPDSQPNPLLLKLFPALFESTGETVKTVNQIINELPWCKEKQWSEAIAQLKIDDTLSLQFDDNFSLLKQQSHVKI